MPIHDWTRVPSGLFHHFHQDWTIEVVRRLNRGILPRGLSALVEQRTGPREADVLTIERRGPGHQSSAKDGAGLLIADRPSTRIVSRSSKELYAGRANRIVVRHHLGRIVAVIEIVSPGNKSSRTSLEEFVAKTDEFFQRGVHLLLVDLFPPTSRDPHGMHERVWSGVAEEEFAFPPGKDRILASYEMGDELCAYVEPVAVGDVMPDMPLFVASGLHARVPLQPTYDAAWDASPEELRRAVETGVLPDPDAD